MISAPDEENLIVKWLFSETVNYKNKGKPVNYTYGFKWATYTRMQKIVFTVLNDFKIPVTRSWYKWGGFVHSDELDSDFTRLRADFSRNPQKVVGLRKSVKKLGIRVDDIQGRLGDIVDNVLALPSKKFLPQYYRTETPLEYRDVYVSKQEISNFLDDLSYADNPKNVLKRQSEIHDYIRVFHKASVKVLTDEQLSDSNYTFTDMIENALDKLDLLSSKGEKITKTKQLFFVAAKSVFDDNIWNSYACEISQRTITGLRSESEKPKMRNIGERLLKQSPTRVESLRQELTNKKLELSMADIDLIKKRLLTKEQTVKAISGLMDIYSRAREGD